MIERDKILVKLEHLRKYVSYLKGYQRHSLEDLQRDATLRGAVERYFQLAIECVLDISHIIISNLKLDRPEDYQSAIDTLGKHGIIPGEFAYDFAPIAGFRNVLVPEYAEVDLQEVYRHLQNDLDDFDKFSQHIIEYLEKSSDHPGNFLNNSS